MRVEDGGLLVGARDDLEVAGGGDLEVGAGTPRAGAGEALVEPRLVHAGRLRRVEDRDPAVGDLGGLGDVLGALGAEPDRDVRAQRVHDRLERLAQPHRALAGVGQRVVRAVVGHRRLAGQHLADDVDDLAGAGQRLARTAGRTSPRRPADRSRPCPGRPGRRRGGRASARAWRSRSACGPDIWTIEVPSRTREVSRPHHASGVNASEPHASAVKMASKPDSSAAATRSPTPCGRLGAPVAELQSELHVDLLLRSRGLASI